MQGISQYEIVNTNDNEEIVSFNDILNKLKVLDIEEDDEIGTYLKQVQKQAISYIENYCNISIFTREILVRFSDYGCPQCNSQKANYIIESTPVNKILNFTIDTGTNIILNTSDYTLLKNNKTFSYIYLRKTLPVLNIDNILPVSISMEIGWGKRTPEDLKRAILEIISILYNNLSDGRVVDSHLDTFVASNIKSLLNNYRVLYV